MSAIPVSTPEQWAEYLAAVARTREQDAADVRSGKRTADSLHFIPRELARQSKPVFPKRYQKS